MKFYGIFSLELMKVRYRAVLIVSLVSGGNILTILKLTGLDVLSYGPIVSVLLAILWYIINMYYFASPLNCQSIIDQFKNESIKSNIIGSILVIIYTLASFVLFIKVKSG